MKRNETKTTLPTLSSHNNNQSNHDSQKRKNKRKKKNDIQIPLPPKGQRESNMNKMELDNSTAVDSNFSKMESNLTDLNIIFLFTFILSFLRIIIALVIIMR
jgi:hypothetical protein